MPRQQLILPSSVAEAIRSTGAGSGDFSIREVAGDGLIVVCGYGVADRYSKEVRSDWLDMHCSSGSSYRPGVGFWYRAKTPELHQLWRALAARDVGVRTEAFREHVNGWNFPGEVGYPALTYTTDDSSGQPEWCAWQVQKDGVLPLGVEVVREDADLFAGLDDAWPVETLERARVLLVGVGSIGSSAAEALQEYGIRRFMLLDPDRLWVRNLARHRLTRSEIGRFKVNAMADLMHSRDPDVVIEPYALDVVDDADAVRGLLVETDVLLVCSDGVESRRVANHLACWAAKPAVFACVLEDGAVGEIVRVLPGASKCLLCFREHLVDGGSFDPEPGLDLPYGTGFRHMPMTAVGGDLDLVGKVAAKAVISTLLEKVGHWEQRLPGNHAVVGLRGSVDLPEPFNVPNASVRWHETGAPTPGCVSCAPN